ncbi:flagellar assembly protein T N-terminal domain-containing protein [Aliiglaciecola sp. LCG003]|uniref:flagellar assembly protein T N-terminal domain-containing protein n=1 Tax=Aliiglaciecola sp. LCG003 TaxID=3053655 RepID=UPI0025736EDA|nr:flagellar assembly protein T N-terminal domain-containing protein [Aliiglaciecola sp. LCG003]WJG11261.1 flagellar assembly protein T N-terminal domain-containing protein [Aliiglaciecola sp. LCG003]
MNAGANAAWFESSGQAAIYDGNIELARQNATQEAIKQALLFAGASVRSVQKMANGLLKNDELEIRSSGEVNSLELIDEVHSDGIITVSIRADIFSQQHSCRAGDYSKTIATTWQPLRNRAQATTGGIFDIGMKLANMLDHSFTEYAHNSKIKTVLPFYHQYSNNTSDIDATILARKSGSQYLLIGSIEDISTEQTKQSSWQFWQSSDTMRNFAYQSALYDGYTGALVWQKYYNVASVWDFDIHQQVDVNSQALWASSYGKLIKEVLQDVVQNVDETLACLPAYGRILEVNGEILRLNLGLNQGVKTGDELTLFQVSQFHDTAGQVHAQFRLHPAVVRVSEIFPESAMAIAVDGSYLGNIQANDFVSRR